MQAILHLGTYKTGSSSLQNLLFDNREHLISHGILYPLTGLVMERHIGFRHTRLIFDHINGKNQACPPALRQEISQSGCRKTILSSEAWANPSHLNHLSMFVESLKDMGLSDIQCIAFLRNIVQYKISLYREFTINQKNVLSYRDFSQRAKGIYNLLFISQAFKAINGDHVTLMAFDSVGDVRDAFFGAIGEAQIQAGLAETELANVKKTDALDVEVIRCANQLKIPPDLALRVAKTIRDKNPGGVWTEYTELPEDHFGGSYMKSFGLVSGWSPEQVDRLFAIDTPPGDSVYNLTPQIMSELMALVNKK